MTDDLVERLREEAKDPRFDTSNFHCDLITEAADEIERLRRAAARTVPPLLIMQAARRLIDWDARSTRGPEVNTVVVSDVVDDALKIARYVAAGRPEPHDEPRHDSSLSPRDAPFVGGDGTGLARYSHMRRAVAKPSADNLFHAYPLNAHRS